MKIPKYFGDKNAHSNPHIGMIVVEIPGVGRGRARVRIYWINFSSGNRAFPTQAKAGGECARCTHGDMSVESPRDEVGNGAVHRGMVAVCSFRSSINERRD